MSKVEVCGRSKSLRLGVESHLRVVLVESQKIAYKSKKVHKHMSTGKEV